MPSVSDQCRLLGRTSTGRRVVTAAITKSIAAAIVSPNAEALVETGSWTANDLVPFHSVAGIAAACAREWTRAEEHHRTAIHQADTAPYRVAQPQAREWYAAMLLARGAPGDV